MNRPVNRLPDAAEICAVSRTEPDEETSGKR